MYPSSDVFARPLNQQSRPQHRLLAALLLGLLPVGPALAQAADKPPADEPAETAQANATQGKSAGTEQRKICRYETTIGTRMRKKVCQTPEQWEARQQAGKNLRREMDDKPISKTPTAEGQG